jgi:hypothetical protein
MDLSILLQTTSDQVVTVVMSYRAMPPLQDYVVIADETTLVYADNELRDDSRVLVPAGHPGLYDTEALDRQNMDFFTAILTGGEPVSSARAIRPAMFALQAAQDELDRQDNDQGSE